LVRLKGFQKLTSVEEALRLWFHAFQTGERRIVNVLLREALNRVLAEDVVAQEDLPRFDRAAVDGYALKAEDTVGASQFKPLRLQLTVGLEVSSKQAKQVWTGNPIPKGADAVVMLENVKALGDTLEVYVQLVPGENVSRKGEDIKKGELAVKAGTRLNPYHLGLLAGLGLSEVKVAAKPRIAIVATGNELTEAGSVLLENQVFETNRTMLSTLCSELDAEPLDLGIAKDEARDIAERVSLGLKVGDAVITTGGTSVGGLDLVPEVVNNLGKPGIIVHGVAMRPAMPTALAVVENKPIAILSGNPVAAVVGFEAFARPLISRLLGMEKTEPRPALKATLTRKVVTALGRKTYVRVKVTHEGNEFYAEPVSARGSGTITTMTRSNGFVIVPENREGLVAGETVTVYMFRPAEEK